MTEPSTQHPTTRTSGTDNPATSSRQDGASEISPGLGLEELAEEAARCTRCRLAEGRTNVVFGSGSGESGLMIVGEAPGFHEDQEGLPFVGNAGKLLDTLLGEVGLNRRDVYIANVLKCRPPGNRDPLDDEIESCSPFLDGQIANLKPAVICTLGNFSTQLLLGRKVGISRLRGQEFPFRGGTLVPTYHPAALLRGGRGQMMADARSDFALIACLLAEAKSKRELGAPAREGGEVEQLGLF